ncbi:MAG: FkbM family methyltransferase [Bacteroidota bacterium]
MTSKAIFLRIVRKLPFLTSFARSIVRKKAVQVNKRKKLNDWYNKLDLDGKAVFHNLFCKILRDKNIQIPAGNWEVDFRKKKIRMPLREEEGWLDWDNALSVLGHDPDVKETYENLLNNISIKVFFDIGANYGTHSLLFLTQGVQTISFEPNNSLNSHFELLCGANHVTGKMENLAVGEKKGIAKLQFPSDATWLGTIVESEATILKAFHQLKNIEVPLVTLDQYVQEKGIDPDLIKIDTEGNEINVLRGARNLLQKKMPLVIFESNTNKDRLVVWNFLDGVGYVICNLPLRKEKKKEILTSDAFFSSRKFNFIAMPNEAN